MDGPTSSESQLVEPEPLQQHQSGRTESSQLDAAIAIESLPDHLEPQHFVIGTVAEDSNFDIAESDSDCPGSEVSSASTADDAYWTSLLHATHPVDEQPARHPRPDDPSDEGGRPSKRHRPG